MITLARINGSLGEATMITLTLYYATNRNHLGQDRWKPDGYGSKFSQDGVENLRFGRLTLLFSISDLRSANMASDPNLIFF